MLRGNGNREQKAFWYERDNRTNVAFLVSTSNTQLTTIDCRKNSSTNVDENENKRRKAADETALRSAKFFA